MLHIPELLILKEGGYVGREGIEKPARVPKAAQCALIRTVRAEVAAWAGELLSRNIIQRGLEQEASLSTLLPVLFANFFQFLPSSLCLSVHLSVSLHHAHAPTCTHTERL